MTSFLKKWAVFLSIVFGPGSAIFILLTVVGLILAYSFKENTLFATLLSILSSVFAGVAGNFIKDDYDAYLGKNTLEKKGRSALRNLETISTQLCNLKVWVCDFQKSQKKGEKIPFLDEIDRHLSTVQLNISSGLEDWVDIVPELKERAQENAEMEKKYKDLAQSYVNELLEKRKELLSSSDEGRTEELKKKIGNLEKQMKYLKQERAHEIGVTSVAGGWGGRVIYPDFIQHLSIDGTRSCSGCGKKITSNPSGIGILGSVYCSDCREKSGL